MKKIKLLSAILAVIVVVTSSYRSETASRPTAQKCFEFTGYIMTEPLHWTMITVPEPTCNYTSGTICYIKTEHDEEHPMEANLIELSSRSNNFTQPYDGEYGRVRLKP